MYNFSFLLFRGGNWWSAKSWREETRPTLKIYSKFNQHFLKGNWILLKLIEPWIKIWFCWNFIRQSASIFVISKTNSDMGALLIPYVVLTFSGAPITTLTWSFPLFVGYNLKSECFVYRPHLPLCLFLWDVQLPPTLPLNDHLSRERPISACCVLPVLSPDGVTIHQCNQNASQRAHFVA